MDITIKFMVAVIVIIVLIFLALDAIVIIGPGERGVQLRWGAVTDHIYPEGWSWKMPIAEGVTRMDVKTQKLQTQASAASSDLQVVTSTIALNFKVKADAVAWLRQNIGTNYRQKIIDPAIQEAIKASTAQFTAEELIAKRPVVRETMKQILQEKLDEISQHSILVEAFNIENFDFSAEFNRAIEGKVTAEQEALMAKNVLEKIKYEAQQAVEKAKGEAEAKIQRATAEAEAIRIQSEALKENPDILQLRWIERWDGKVPYFLGSGGETDLIFNMPSQQ